MGVVGEHTKVIDGITYRARTLPASDAAVLLPRLINVIGKRSMAVVLGALFPALFPAEDGEERPGVDAALAALMASPEVVAALIGEASERMAADDRHGLEALSKLLLKGVTADKVRIGAAQATNASVLDHYDTHFAGGMMHMLVLCTWIIGINFTKPWSGSQSTAG
jgi:tail assembly chaperone